jgi:hypothetical protein
MSATRSAIAAVEIAVAAIGIAVTVSRHPLVRAGIKAAPHLMTPQMKQMAERRARDAAFAAGALARRIVPRSLIG